MSPAIRQARIAGQKRVWAKVTAIVISAVLTEVLKLVVRSCVLALV